MAQARRKYLEKDSKICGRYVLRKLLKTEPIGITYGAVDQLNRRKVAIFEYFPQGMTERDHIFCNQVRVIDYNKSQVYYQGKHAIVECALTMMKYHHEKGIISVLEYMEMNNTVYIVYEYEKGVSLADYVSSKGPFPEAEFITKMEPVIEAVKELHKSGLAHGNITPDTLKAVSFSGFQPKKNVSLPTESPPHASQYPSLPPDRPLSLHRAGILQSFFPETG